MPIKPENRVRYPADWKDISQRVRDEAGQRCEWCRAMNGAMIVRGSDDQEGASLPGYRYVDAPVFDHTFHAQTGKPIPGATWDTFDANARGPVRVVLTVAHLDHRPENNCRSNLAALCQKCHLNYDKDHHAANAAATRRAKLAKGDLFEGD
jgi:5-methylcytosine-specific restriction endonuclease McrA